MKNIFLLLVLISCSPKNSKEYFCVSDLGDFEYPKGADEEVCAVSEGKKLN